jgi:hypothetical protein
MRKSGEFGDASFNPVPSQYPRKLYDDQSKKDWKPELRMDLYGLVVADIHGQTRERFEVDNGDLPKTILGLLLERARNERRLEKLLSSPEAAVFWDAVVDADAECTEDEELALSQFIFRDADGKVAVDDHVRWPKHSSYAEVARQLHFIDPVKFKNRDGGVPSREVTKGLVLRCFAKKHQSMLKKYGAKVPTYDEVWKQAEYYFGDPWKQTQHQTNL